VVLGAAFASVAQPPDSRFHDVDAR
jgi:hypothetical protein